MNKPNLNVRKTQATTETWCGFPVTIARDDRDEKWVCRPHNSLQVGYGNTPEAAKRDFMVRNDVRPVIR